MIIYQVAVLVTNKVVVLFGENIRFLNAQLGSQCFRFNLCSVHLSVCSSWYIMNGVVNAIIK